MSLSKTMLPNIGGLRQREVRRIYLPRTSVNKGYMPRRATRYERG
jgi:hypothetical protein